MGSEQFEENQQAIASLNKRVLGKGIIDTLRNISAGKGIWYEIWRI
jgi:hypothetical protein